MEHVNHPSHYNQHPAGIECIGATETRVIYWRGYIERATYCIQQRIDELTAPLP